MLADARRKDKLMKEIKRKIMLWAVKKFRLGQYVSIVEDMWHNDVQIEWGWR
jgi:hypothetical protein